MLQSLAQHYGFDLEQPFEKLPTSACSSVVLYGSGEEKIAFRYPGERGRSAREASIAFEGIVPNLERRYRETDSVVGARRARQVPQHAAPARSAAARGCGAKRATCKVGRAQPIYELSALPLRAVRQPSSTTLELPGAKQADRRAGSCARSPTACSS